MFLVWPVEQDLTIHNTLVFFNIGNFPILILSENRKQVGKTKLLQMNKVSMPFKEDNGA